MTMNINEMESLAKANSGLISWPCNIPADSILELISAYREAVAALSDPALYCSDTTYCDEFCCREKQRNALATAKHLGVE